VISYDAIVVGTGQAAPYVPGCAAVGFSRQ
jgi:hypothetical protein